MTQLLFYDSSVYVGKSAYKHREQLWKTERIVDELDRAGIAGALVYQGMARSHSPRYGNGLLPTTAANLGRTLISAQGLPLFLCSNQKGPNINDPY